MLTKICTKCKQEKSIDNFSKNISTKDGFSCWCKQCKKEDYDLKHPKQEQNIPDGFKFCNKCKTLREIKYFNKNCNSPDGYYSVCTICQKEYKNECKQKPKIKIKHKICSVCGIDKSITEYYKDIHSRDNYSSRCKRCSDKIYYNNRDKIIEKRNKRIENLDKINVTEKVCSKCKILKPISEFVKNTCSIDNHRNTCKSCENELSRDRYVNNSNLRINRSISVSVLNSLKQNKAGRHWETLVPYTFEELKQHLENQFDENMNWDNYGTYWEIDHIIPKNLFDITDENCEDFKICWSLTNLRPLEKSANRRRPRDGSDIPENIKQEILNLKVV